MKIAFLSMYSGSVARGSETFVHELANRLSSNNKITVFQEGPKPKDSTYEVERIDIAINWKKNDATGTLARRFFVDYWSRLICIFTLKSIPRIWKEKYDVVVPLNGGWQPAFIRIVTWLYGGKMVVSGQSGMGWDDRNNLWSFPDAFVALSKKGLSWARRANPFVR
jgi:hypothetical protein